jgi:hypothetical protein
MLSVETSPVSGNRIYRCGEHAIHLDGVDIVQVTENTLQDAGHSITNRFDAVYVTASHRVTVRNNIVYGSARYAVNLDGYGTGMTVTGNPLARTGDRRQRRGSRHRVGRQPIVLTARVTGRRSPG